MSSPESSEMRIVRAQLRDFISQNFLYGATDVQLDDDTSLIASGVLDDTGVLELVLFVEETYGLTVNEGELGPANFDTITSIATFVVAHLSPNLAEE